jgi:Na+/H+ antiporter NhaA
MTQASGDPRAWFRGETPAGTRLSALRGFLNTEAGGAVVLLAATVAALVWANSPLGGAYDAFWSTELSFRLGGLELSHDLQDWVNDGLMTLFFLLIGLEVRREFDMGEFRERRRVAAPVIAALGGMLLPIVIFLALNAGGEAARGWAMVMATDTAFAVGVLALVGRRSSFRLRPFLLTLVIIDDVAAVTVIAVVYSTDVELTALAAGIGLLALMGILRMRGTAVPGLYALLGLGIWLASSAAGVHPTVAGVAIGLLTSAYPPRRATLEAATGVTRAFRQRPTPDLANEAARRITMSLSPNERLQHALHPWTSFVVVPLFALANAGVDLSPELIGGALGSSLVIGIILGLVVGKSLGIPIGSWLATRPWLGGAQLSVGWPSLVAASSVAGIGFTMSLLIAELSYTGTTLDQAKLGILTASAVAAGLSLVLFYGVGNLPREWLRRAEARTAPPVTDLTDRVDPERDHVRGAPDALLTLLEYGDYECPHCARAAPAVLELLRQHGDRLRFVFRHLPLADVHPNAALAAQAAEAAGAQGHFWEMHDRLFANQERLRPHDLVDHARALGLDVARFEADLRKGTFAGRVGQDVNSAEEAGVAGTPTFFVNEVRYRGPYDRDSLKSTLRRVGAIASERAALAGSPGAETPTPG